MGSEKYISIRFRYISKLIIRAKLLMFKSDFKSREFVLNLVQKLSVRESFDK